MTGAGGWLARRGLRTAVVMGVVGALLSPSLAVAGDAPVAAPESYRVRTGKQLNIPASKGVLANDSDPEGDRLSAVLVDGPAWGTLTLRRSGAFTYKPNVPATIDRFTYVASDGATSSFVMHVSITVDAAPVAADDAWGVLLPGPLSVPAPGVLGNDHDPGGELIEAQLVRKPAHGVLELAPDGGFTYTPRNRRRVTTDSFTYRAVDQHLRSRLAVVRLRVLTENRPPTGVPDTFTGYEDVGFSEAAPGVLANDTDPDGDPLQAILEQYPGGVDDFVLEPDGSFYATLPPSADNDTAFLYRVTDGVAVSAPILVTLDVIPINNPPTGQDDYYEMNADSGPLVVPAPGVLANDYDDIEFDAPHVHDVVAGPGDGQLTLNTDGSFTYLPDPGFSGDDGFIYRPADSSVGFETRVVIVVYPPPEE